ncbi:hypothetical protein [uncultured Succiniclasticum sp.]|uniref:hypothetical protein n=1 Tax=uncultured Succiniclasticum sp. TaxID=1500547 RepID=UPI0025E41A60|nr:hypothetical protein [uncultured Succiniclasticum sp.]
MDERFVVIKNAILKKLGVIILCGLVCAGLLVLEKAFFTKFVIQAGGPVTGEYIVSVVNPKDRSNPKKQLNYPAVMHSDANLAGFITLLDKERHFEFVKLNPNWNRLTDVQQRQWLRQHVRIQNYQRNNFRILYNLRQAEVYDLAFLEKNSRLFMDSFIQQTNRTVKKIKPGPVVKVVSRNFSYPKELPLDRNDILIKYGIIGFVFGMLLAILVVIVPAIRGFAYVL